MSGRAAVPAGSKSEDFWRTVAEVAAALAVMYSAVVIWHRDRIEKDCFCSSGTAGIFRVVAWIIAAVFVAWLAILAYRTWRRCTYDSCRAFLTLQRRHFGAASVPWLTAIVGIVVLTVPSQTADLLAGLNGRTWHEVQGALIPFGLGALAWASSVWFCGRWSIDVERRTTEESTNRLIVWNPRVLALITGFAIVVIAVKAAGLCSGATFVASLIASLVFLFAMLRRRLFSVEVHVAAPGLPRSQKLPFHAAMGMAPGGETVLWIVFAVSAIVIGIAAINPQIATLVQAPGTALLGLGGLTVIGTFFSRLRASLTRWPVLLLLLIATILLAQKDFGVNHDIRKIKDAPIVARSSLHDAALAWLNHCGPHLLDRDGREITVVLVSTAGGASRAALWTLDALYELEARDNMFPGRVFAISAVSGGALGATVWTALLAHDGFDCAVASQPSDPRNRRDKGVEVLRRDFLAPVLAAWISRDVPFGVAPINMVLRHLGIQVDDRSAALEEAWEVAWRDTIHDDTLGQDFLALWNGKFNRPLLLLNGTDEDTGQPVVTAPVALVDDKSLSDGSIPATYDALWLLHGEIRTSTAILNAARFPVVTSQGDLRLRRCPDGTISESGMCGPVEATYDKISVVDGGYFDNIGAGTTLRVADALRAAFEETDLRRKGVVLRIMVVGINSDPDRLVSAEAWNWIDPNVHHDEVNQLMHCDKPRSTLTIGEKGLANTLDAEIAPVLAIVNTQSGHTALRMAELNMMFCPKPGDTRAPDNYIIVSLCPIGDSAHRVSLPLNWILPPATIDLFDDMDHADPPLPAQCENKGQFDTYGTWVTGH